MTKTRCCVRLLPFFAAATLYAQAPLLPPLLTPTDRAGAVAVRPDPTVVRARNVQVNLALLTPQNNRISIPLFDGPPAIFVKQRQWPAGPRGVAMHGIVEGEAGSRVVLVMVGAAVEGKITRANGAVFQLRFLGNGVHQLRQLDQSKFPEGQDMVPVPIGGNAADAAKAALVCNDPANEISTMVLYTAAAKAGAGGPDGIEATIYLAVEEANQAYINSGVSHRLRISHIREYAYAESGAFLTDLNSLKLGSGVFSTVPGLRDTYAADLVLLIEEQGDNCGLAFFNSTTGGSAFAPHAFGVVRRDCATGNYSFAHEVGHLMGARHNKEADSGTVPYPQAHGYIHLTPPPAFRDIMGVAATCGNCPRLQFFSNLNLLINNNPTGNAAYANLAAVFNTLAPSVANFRCQLPTVSGVWMKDTWADTGAEPNPNTAGEDMWKSPYIWNRTAQDVTKTKQHEHQNPEAGAPNWVYAKLHNNGSAPAAGQLQFYIAKASSGFTWTGNWTQIGAVPVTVPANGVAIAEAPWTPPAVTNGDSHYCMIARWVSSGDPMHTPETADINYNTVQNNNIVWRNMNIVDLMPDKPVDVSFLFRNISREPVVSALVIKVPRDEAARSFLRNGQVSIVMGAKLMAAWMASGGRGSGFIRNGDRLVANGEAVVLDGIAAPPGLEDRVSVRFAAGLRTPQGKYNVDFAQQSVAAGRRVNVGGVSYEVRVGMTRMTPLPSPGNSTNLQQLKQN